MQVAKQLRLSSARVKRFLGSLSFHMLGTLKAKVFLMDDV